ncbi:MAG: hypothetical protein ACLRMG_15750 [Clostridium sp.]|nr:hypothetical protein [uncultured Terrisporobacter sp.]
MSKKYDRLKNIILVIMFYILIFQNALENYFKAFGILDEAISLILLLYGIYMIIFNSKKVKIDKHNVQIIICSIVIGAIGLTGNMIYKYQETIPLIKDGIALFKGIITYICVPMFFMDLKVSDYLEIINKHLKIISVSVLILVLGNFIFDIFPYYEIRFGIKSQQIFFSHPTYLASFSALLVGLLSVNLKKHKENKIYIFISLIILTTTLRFKAIAFIPIYMYMFYIVIIKERKLQIKDIVILCILGGIFAITQIREYVQNPDWARSALSITSLKIGKDHFPIGTGFGTYASWVSGESYSKIYDIYGLNKVWGLSSDFYWFVADTFWPMIIGQFGFIGLAIYTFIIYKIYRNIKNNDNLYYYFGQILLLLYLLVLSVAEASFSGPIVVMYMVFIGLLGKDRDKGISYIK